MPRENPPWGSPRILSELLLLGHDVSEATVDGMFIPGILNLEHPSIAACSFPPDEILVGTGGAQSLSSRVLPVRLGIPVGKQHYHGIHVPLAIMERVVVYPEARAFQCLVKPS